MAKAKYVKLGEKAAGFHDHHSGVLVSGKMVIKLTHAQAISNKVKKALLGGHLEHADKDEYDAWVKFEASTRTDKKPENSSKALETENEELKARIKELEEETKETKSPFDNMTGNALVKYYKDNYEVDEDEVQAFEEKELAEKRTFLKELDTED